jgi:hypothetical protein
MGAASSEAAHSVVNSRWRAVWRDAGGFKSGSGGAQGKRFEPILGGEF